MTLYPTILTIAITLIFNSLSYSNVYVIIYATIDGRTGHAGIAIDNYRIQKINNSTDTLADGTLTYFDVWPETDDFGIFNLSKDSPSVFYKLPNSIWPSALTLAALYDNGIPHRKHYPCDAILMLPSSPADDFKLLIYLEEVAKSGKSFNPRFYNCSDFVSDAITQLTGKRLRAKELMPFSFTTTPNKLCKRLMEQDGVVVIKSPEEKIKGSFMRERIFKSSPDYNPFDNALSMID